MSNQTISVSSKRKFEMPDQLFGLFLEDLSFTIDGGLNANMVCNYSFDGIYLSKYFGEFFAIMHIKPKQIFDRLRYWDINGKVESLNDKALSNVSYYARVHDNCILENKGYNGNRKNNNECSMSIVKGENYEFSCYLRANSYNGSMSVCVVDDDNKLTTVQKITPTNNWEKYTVNLSGIATKYGKLRLVFEGSGTVDIDFVTLMNTNFWGNNDKKWSQGKFRSDMVMALKDLDPKFLRFPGGCIIEGLFAGNEYCWKDTVGPITERKSKVSLWSIKTPDSGYMQTHQIGYYEYFCLAEDLGAEPLPIVWAGMNCQIRSFDRLPLKSEAFQERVVQDALDMIEYANGDPATSKWAKMRADAGHPAPFNVKTIGIGNENFGGYYMKAFKVVRDAIKEKHPEMMCILSAGLMFNSWYTRRTWKLANSTCPNVYVDEHFYMPAKWCINNRRFYKTYDRNAPKVFLGEYAAYNLASSAPGNLYKSALAEAAFLTGIEQDSDVVAKISYAPLFALSEGENWKHMMINHNPKTVLRTINYLVQKMFGTNTGKYVLEATDSLGKNIYYSAIEDDEDIILKIANCNTNEVVVDVVLENNVKDVANIQYLQSDDLKVKNTITFKGDAQYTIDILEKQLELKSNKAQLIMPKNSFYVIRFRKS